MRSSRAAWAVRGVLLFVLAFANVNDIWSPDVIPNALLPWTILRQGDLDYDEYTGPGRLDREAYFFRACGSSTATEPPKVPRSVGGPPAPGPNDHVCSVFPPGMGLLALPFFIPFVIAVPDPDVATLVRVGHGVAALFEAVATLLLWSVFLRSVGPRAALGLALLYALGTSVRTIGSQALWQHAGVHLSLAAALWLIARPEALSPWRAFWAGLAVGVGSVVRQTTVLFAALGTRPRWPSAAGVVVGALPLAVYGVLAFGSPLEQGYGPKPFDPAGVATGAYGLLLSPSRGWLIYEPFIVFALASLALAWRRPDPLARSLRGGLFTVVAFVLLYATYAEWWGGRVFGPRFLDDLAPLLFVALAWGIGQGLLRRTWARVAFAVSAAWSLLLFNAAALVFTNARWDMLPRNVNDDPSRLFDWSDPQWLAVLRDLPGGGPGAAVAAGLSGLTVLALLRLEGVLLASRR